MKTGSYFTSVTDLQLPTPGFPLVISRDYYSARVVDSGLGRGWSFSAGARLFYTHYLLSAPNTYQKRADITFPDGRQYDYIENADRTTYTPTPGRKDTLVRNTDGSWDLTPQRSRSRYHFSPAGALLSMSDDNGNTIEATYDTSGRLERVADTAGSGRYLTVSYGADGRVSAVEDSAGRQVRYAYDASEGTLESVSDPENRTTTYTYTQGRFSPVLAGITDNWDRVVTTITYGSYGRVQSYTENGETYTYTYGYQGNRYRTAKTDSLGNTSLFTYDDVGLITQTRFPGNPSPIRETQYNADGAATRVADEVGIAEAYLGYDAQGNYTRRFHQNPDTTWDYRYDTSFPEKLSRVVALNAGWQSSHYDYYPVGSDAPGNLFHVYRVKSDGSEEAVATYEYYPNGQVKSLTNAAGGRTNYTYDAQGDLETVTGPPNNDAGNRPVTVYGHDALGRVVRLVDPLGNETSYAYDSLGRVTSVKLPTPSGAPDGIVGATLLDFTTTYSYDLPGSDADAGLVFTEVRDPNRQTTRLGYDQYGRLVKSYDPAGNATSYAYSHGHLASITDANHNVTRYAYDERGRLKQTTFPDGAAELYTYRPDSLLKTKTDRKGQTTTYTYDSFKRLATKSYSSGGSITFNYQGQNLVSVVDTSVSPAETHSFGYDSAFRVASHTQGPRGTVSYTYTPEDRVATMSVGGGASRTNSYYPDGSLDTIGWSRASGQFKYRYTLAGQYEQITFPNGQHRDYAYDEQGRLVSLANVGPAANLAAYTYGYDLNPTTGQPSLLGQRTSLTAYVPAQGFDGALTRYSYDALYQLTGVAYPAVAPFLIALGEELSPEADAWTYDAIGNRLTSARTGSLETLTYLRNGPQNGQRLQARQLQPAGTISYGYDANGNATSEVAALPQSVGASYSLTFGYDHENRLASISGDEDATYAYDHQGRRASKAVGGATASYLYDGQDLVRETGPSGTADYLFGPGIDEPLAMYGAGQTSYFDVDGLGSVVATNDAAGTVTHAVVFDAWGNARAETGTRNHPFTYTGREVGEASLLFYRARYYGPATGRFTQEDPIIPWYRLHRRGPTHFETTLFYGYVENSPQLNTDPLGLKSCGPRPIDTGECAYCDRVHEWGLCRLKEAHQAEIMYEVVGAGFGAIGGGVLGKNPVFCIVGAGAGFLIGHAGAAIIWHPGSEGTIEAAYRACRKNHCEDDKCLENPNAPCGPVAPVSPPLP